MLQLDFPITILNINFEIFSNNFIQSEKKN